MEAWRRGEVGRGEVEDMTLAFGRWAGRTRRSETGEPASLDHEDNLERIHGFYALPAYTIPQCLHARPTVWFITRKQLNRPCLRSPTLVNCQHNGPPGRTIDNIHFTAPGIMYR